MKILSRKWLLLAVTTMLALSFAAISCSYANATTEDIVNQSQAAGAKIKSYQFDLNLNLTLATTGSNPAENMNLSIAGDAKGALDNANKNAHMLLNVNAEIPTMGNQKVPVEYYLVGGWMCAKLGIPILGDQWTKVQLQESQWTSQDQIAQQLGFLKTAVQVDQVGTENVDNVACYVLAVKPDLAKISDWLTSLEKSLGPQEQQFNLPSSTPGNIDLSKFIKQLSIKEWIAEDSYLITKAEIAMDISASAADLGLPTGLPVPNGGAGLDQANPSIPAKSNGQLTMSLSASMQYHNYDEPVTITLPSEAQNAKEISSPNK